MKTLDIRDISIIDALPTYDVVDKIMTVGCGQGRLEWHLHRLGYEVLATDLEHTIQWSDKTNRNFMLFDILKDKYISKPVVICSETLEHIANYKQALLNLLKLSEIRLIITVPVDHSFNCAGHINHWNDNTIKEFTSICKPYSVSISKIRTKPEDVKFNQWCYLIIVDKRQFYES